MLLLLNFLLLLILKGSMASDRKKRIYHGKVDVAGSGMFPHHVQIAPRKRCPISPDNPNLRILPVCGGSLVSLKCVVADLAESQKQISQCVSFFFFFFFFEGLL